MMVRVPVSGYQLENKHLDKIWWVNFTKYFTKNIVNDEIVNYNQFLKEYHAITIIERTTEHGYHRYIEFESYEYYIEFLLKWG